MDEKPEIVFFSEYKMGGVQNYYHNLILNDEDNFFDKTWIFTNNVFSSDAKIPEPYQCCLEKVFDYGFEHIYKSTKKLNLLISNKPGLIMVNHDIELITLHKYRKSGKTIVYVCHDELYLQRALKFEFLIDFFVAHNIYFYNKLKELLPANRNTDIYYLPYGVYLTRKTNKDLNEFKKLKIVFIARLHEKKGIYELPKINKQLLKNGVSVEWIIIGDGPEKEKFKELVINLDNFSFHTPPNTIDVLKLASTGDVFILPSYLEGIPVALLEAMSIGLVPIIYNFNPGISNVVDETNGFIVETGELNEIADKINLLDKDRLLLNKLSIEAQKKIERNFDSKTCSKKYYDLFKQFKYLKKNKRTKFIQYDGRFDYPFIPQIIRNLYRWVRHGHN